MEQKRYRSSMVQHHRWSSLPDEIIINIMSRFNLLRDTVIIISTTNFSIKRYDKPIDNIDEYWTILDNLFTLFAPPVIDTFCLNLYAYHYNEPQCWPIIDTWVRQLRSRNVQHMKLSCFPGFRQFDNRIYPPSIFRIDSLVTLELRLIANGIGWRLPNSFVLPNLKKLYFSLFDYAYLGRLLGCCPSLEDLSLNLYHPKESVVLITSKSLKRLHIKLEGKSIHDVIIDTPILEQLNYCSNYLLSMHMLNSISNVVKSLTLSTGSPVRFINCCTTLPKLIRLKLSFGSEIFQAIFDQQMMMHCPNLEVLVLHLFDGKEMIWNQDAVFMLVQQVKHIELYANVNRFSKYGLSLVTWFLRSAPVLEKLAICGYGARPIDDSLSQFCKTLVKCAEDTSCCQIDFLGGFKLDTEVQG